MSGRSVLFVVAGGAAVAVIAWLAWPRGARAPAALDAAAAPRVTPPVSVRKPDDAPAGAVRFALRDARGAPLPDVELTVTPRDGGGAPATATSGADGVASLSLVPGRYALALGGWRIEGAADLELDGTLDRDLIVVAEAGGPAPPAPPDLGADRSGGVTGVVIGGGARLPDLTVALVYDGPIGPGHPVAHRVAPQPIAIPPRRFVGGGGAFRWPELPAGGYDVWISAPDWGAVHTRTTVVANGWGDASVTLAPAASLSGTVVDGRAVAIDGVTVTAELEGRVLAEATTGTDGVYLLDQLPAGTLTVRARIAKDVCEPKTDIVSTTGGQRTPHRIEMECAWQSHAPPGQP